MSERLTAPLVCALALGLSLQGCASSEARQVEQQVRIEAPGCSSMVCELQNDRGRWLVPSTPGTVLLTTSKSPLEVSCRSKDGAFRVVDARSSATPMSGAPAVVGGVAGGATAGAVFGSAALSFIPVLGVVIVATGIATGAAVGQAAERGARTLNYPDVISIPAKCAAIDQTEDARTAAEPAGPLGMTVRGLSVAEARDAGLGHRSALLVTDVTADGAASAAGLRTGDLILSAGGDDLGDPAGLESRVLATRAGNPLAMRIQRGAKVHELTLVRPALAR
jgi:hypothetical protein